MQPYIREAKYYETDQMGIIHHSNYIRWMEEARIDLLDQIGYPYSRFEEMGYMSPVLHADCEYKKSVKFDDLDDHTRFIAILATLLGSQAIDEFKAMLTAAYNFDVTPVEMKEIVYQAVAYLGIGRVFPFIQAKCYFS